MSKTPNIRLYIVFGLISLFGFVPSVVQFSLAIDAFSKNENDYAQKLVVGGAATSAATIASVVGIYKWRLSQAIKSKALLDATNPEV